MIFIRLFGFIIAAGVVFTSLAMMIMGGRWQKIEASAYSGKRRPIWFILISICLIALYIIAFINFIPSDKNWASWILMCLLPIGWVIKGILVVFNKEGREKVSNISGDKAWIKIGLARLPIAVLLIVLSLFVK
ncbi:hypothetical protein [Romboutsia sp.]|uniref:hypothetical protein n=1 Tax=Romboutsia sp. TaxID=1965302 RepID=UPI002B884C93|nr:hypothetical protein [Romboutsia sp.]HSQ88795.1 hypothetical protein [Romboutsia sp.]